MAKLDLRMRLVGLLTARASVASMSPERIAAVQRRSLGHNPITDLVLGGVARGVVLRDDTVDGETGRLPVRIHRPIGAVAEPPLVVHFHGGGWTLGSLDQSDWLCSHIARQARAVVVSVDYRLAPQHRWPAAAEDCYAALVALAGSGKRLGADTGRLAVVGDSAGGNLAAVVSLMARDRSGPAIAFQGLAYPATDLTLASPSIRENASAPVLTERDVHAYRRHYLGDQDPAEPYASPLLAGSHRDLPPALVQVAEHDPIRDDGLRYAEALRAAGVPVRTTTYVGMPHGYLSFPHLCRSAPQALSELATELRTALGT